MIAWGAVLLACNAAPVLGQANGVGSPFELAFWQAVADSDDAAQYEAYLGQYPQGTFAAIARLKITALGGGVPVAAPAPPAPVAPAPVAPAPLAPAPSAPAPAVAAAPAVQLAAEVAPVAAQVPPPALAAPPAPAPAPAPAAAPAADGRAELIARAGAIQSGMAPATVAVAMPAVPQLVAVPQVPIPPTFCSAIARNAYHDEVYRPARRAAQDNNRAAITYLRQLQELYDGYGPSRDFERMNAIADAAQAYEPVADDTYEVTVTYDALFDRLMAVRIVDCGTAQ